MKNILLKDLFIQIIFHKFKIVALLKILPTKKTFLNLFCIAKLFKIYTSSKYTSKRRSLSLRIFINADNA